MQKQSAHIPFENVTQILVVCCFHKKKHEIIKPLKFSNIKTRFGTYKTNLSLSKLYIIDMGNFRVSKT